MLLRILLLGFFLFEFGTSTFSQTMGLMLQTEDSFDGYSLFTPMASKNTYLIDNCGKLVHEWSSEYNPGLSVYLLPNGDLLRTGRIFSSFTGGGSGGIIERINWEDEVVWSYVFSSEDYHQHHDVAIMPNGNILVNAWERVSREDALAAGREIVGNFFWSNYIAEIEPIGSSDANIIWEWRAIDHLVQNIDSSRANYGIVSDHPHKIDINLDPGTNPDWLHVNAIDYNPILDQIVISVRDLHEIWVIDHSTTTAEAKSSIGGNYGKGGDLLYRWGNPINYGRGTADDQMLFGQHDVQWIPDGYPGTGSFSVYNNGNGRPGGTNFSTVEVWEPPMDSLGFYHLDSIEPFEPAQTDWIVGDDDIMFFSSRISGAQRLENGNTIICVGREGRFLEVDGQGSIVWEYINPVGSGVQTQGSQPFLNDAFRVTRYALNYSGFSGRDLQGNDPIELEPLDYECELFLANNDINHDFNNISIYPNPAFESISVQSEDENFSFAVIDVTGRVLIKGKLESNSINVSSLDDGLYYLILNHPKVEQQASTSFVVSRR